MKSEKVKRDEFAIYNPLSIASSIMASSSGHAVVIDQLGRSFFYSSCPLTVHEAGHSQMVGPSSIHPYTVAGGGRGISQPSFFLILVIIDLG